MLVVLQILTISGMVGATFLIYQALGPRRSTLTFSRAEKKQWDALVGRNLGNWLTRTNIFSSVTSLATVYVFFIGNTYRFGWWIAAAVVTMWAGAFVTNFCTKALFSRPAIAARLNAADQSASVLLSIFSEPSDAGRRTTAAVRWITLANIAALLWMEFSVFADVSSKIISEDNIWIGLILIFICSFAVIFFTLRYGLRGFVFADLFQTPMVVIGTFVLFFGALFVIARGLASSPDGTDYSAVFLKVMNAMSTPSIPVLGGVLFCGSCLFLNAFLVLVTEPHWLRLWVFGGKETKLQVSSLTITCALWTLLILVGALASIAISLSSQGEFQNSNEVVVFFLRRLTEGGSPLFAVAFWVAGMAALFSSADAQIYSFMLVERFDVQAGALGDTRISRIKPFLHSLVAACGFTGLYWVVRNFHVPFDQLVLVLLPSCLTIAPSLVLAIRGVPQAPVFIWVAVALYGVCAGLALLVPGDDAEIFAVAAPLMALLVSLAALFYRPTEVSRVEVA